MLLCWRTGRQGYKNEQYVDLWDFCDRLQKRTNKIGGKLGSDIRNACIRVKNAIQPDRGQDQGLAFRSGYRGAAFQHSHGVSVFFPWAKLTDAAGISDLAHYSFLDFAKHTHWDEFLGTYLDKTIGPPRHGKKDILRHSFLNRRPFLYFPLRHHFEQNFHVRYRLERYGAGKCMDFDRSTPDVIAEAVAEEIRTEVSYRAVESGGADRAAKRIAELI